MEPEINETDLGNKEILAKNLKRLMAENEIDRQKLAEAINVKYSSVSDWLNGYYYPRMDSIVEMAKFFHVDKDVLIEDPDSKVQKLKKARIPVLGSIPAGIPLEMISDDYTVDYEEIPASWLNGKKQYFALKLSGDSMSPDYGDGDVVVFLKTPECSSSGQDCCIRIGNDEATFKRVKISEKGLKLIPLNKNNSSGFKETSYSWEEVENIPIQILGVAKKLSKYL